MIRKVLVIGLVVTLLAVGAGAVLAFRRPEPGPPVEVRIPNGASTAAIAQLLEEQEVIGFPLGFRVMAKLRGLEGAIQAGRYELRRGMGVHAALDVLAAGARERSTAVTIPEGYTVDQVTARLGQRTHLDQAELQRLATGGEIRAPFQPDDVLTLEGFLFPETYEVFAHESAEQILRRMVDTFAARTADLDWSVPESKGLSRYDALIMASIVEREAKVPEDRAKVAAVIYNRLERGMRLQIDITALYGREHKVPTRRDLRVESPYNTYVIDGLPPTPIANPGLDAIKAVLDPAPIDAIFYVVVDPSGKHAFTDDPREFERLKRLRPPEVRGG